MHVHDLDNVDPRWTFFFKTDVDRKIDVYNGRQLSYSQHANVSPSVICEVCLINY